MRFAVGLLLLAGAALLTAGAGVAFLAAGSGPPPSDGPVRVFVARRILTMDAARPEARAVAVRGGRILAVGERPEVERALGDRAFTLDETFRDKVILPGFIDPHVHPGLAVVLGMEIVSAMEWETPRGRTRAVRGREAFLARIAELAAEGSPEEWLAVWGYHEPYHGRIRRAELDRAAGGRPVLVWQRSCHEMIFNSGALEALELREADFTAQSGADWETGHLWEAGLLALAHRVQGVLFSPARFADALSQLSQVLHRGGLTTVGEQGFPQRSVLAELGMLHLELRGEGRAHRWALVPNAAHLMREHGGDAAAAERAAERLLRLSTDRVRVQRHVKYYADGAIFAQLMQMSEPYLDGHHGEWMAPPEEQRAILEVFWARGWTVHVHVNGDAGLDLVLDQVAQVQARHPAAPGQRVILEHLGIARPDQHERIRALGVEVSNNAYYTHELAPIYAEHGLGPERAARISPLGGLARAGVPFSFHSDFPMAPAEPLRLAWVAVNRIGSDGRTWGAEERIPVELALRAITLEGARSLGLEDEIGSLAVGKRADFTILEADPTALPPEQLAEIPIWGTVLDGNLHPLE